MRRLILAKSFRRSASTFLFSALASDVWDSSNPTGHGGTRIDRKSWRMWLDGARWAEASQPYPTRLV